VTGLQRAASCLLVTLLAAPGAGAQVPSESSLTGSQVSLRTRLGVDSARALQKDPDPEQRQRSYERLGSVGSAQALDTLLKAFETGGSARTAEDRLIAVRALAPHAQVPAVREFLVRIMVGVGSNPGHSEPIDGLIEAAAALSLARAGDDAALNALGKALRQPGHVAETASDALRAFPPARLEPLFSGLGSPTRSQVLLLGDLGDVRAIPRLRELVQSAPSDVRPEAAVALARLGDTDTIALSRHWLRHENSPAYRLASARILLEFHAPDATSAVASALSDESSRPTALDWASRTSLPGLADLLVKTAGNLPSEQRSASFGALSRTGTHVAFSFLAGALRVRETSSAAALALALSPTSEAEAALATALRTPGTRRAAVRASLVRKFALGRVPSGLSEALQELASSKDETDRALLAQASAALSPARTPALLKQATRPELRALARLSALPEVARALCERLAVEPDLELREALAAGLVSLSSAALVPSDVLLGLLEARGVAAPLAARALAARDSRSLRPKIAALLVSRDPRLRGHAALGLGQSNEGSALGLLERAYRFETDPGVRLSLVQALGARREPVRRRALDLARTTDSAASVREAAALALTGAEPAPAAPGQQSAWLELLLRESDARGADMPAAAEHGRATLGAMLVTADGLAIPAFADPDGVLLFPALPSGPFELRLAAPTRNDNAPSPRQLP